MPNFNISPVTDDELQPVIPAEEPDQKEEKNPVMEFFNPANRVGRAEQEYRLEESLGPLKPLGQFLNVVTSPRFQDQMLVGPVNAISKLGNALGDVILRKPSVDTSDAWQISPEFAAKYNPLTLGRTDRLDPAASDEAAEGLGAAVGGEIVGFGLSAGALNVAKRVPQIVNGLDKLRKTQVVKNLAVAQAANPKLRTVVGLTTEAGKAVAGSTAAVPFIDPTEGNALNFLDLFGVEAPGRIDAEDDYFTAFGKAATVDGVLAPLAVLGGLSFAPPIRRALVNDGAGFFDDLAKVELEPYMPPAIDPSRALPPAPPKYDSAIARSLDDQTQIAQVVQQRNRLQDMGVVEQGAGGQLELAMPGVVNPEIKLQIRQLQTLRGQLLKAQVDEGVDVVQELGKVDQQIVDLMQSGEAAKLPPSATTIQPELDLPDGRPEMDTMLAQLDELDDAALRQMHSDITAPDRAARTAAQMEELQAVVEGNPERLSQIQARLEAGEVTETGAKRLVTKEKKTLEAAQAQLNEIQARTAEPEKLVGDQLELSISQQMAMDLTEAPRMKTFDEIAQSKVRSGYRSAAEYRDALNQFPRDVLRGMTAPGQSPRVAQLVKARTGRRIWSAKKSDIIDALVELSEREDRFLPPEMAQTDMNLTMNQFGADAPLFELPADLTVQGRMVKIVDADGIEQSVPVSDFVRRGMDGVTRERLKQEIIEQAVKNGEVQPPITPIPERPRTDLAQGDLFDVQLNLEGMDVPLYQASKKPLEAVLEELRLRYNYRVLDEAAQKAQKQALKDAYRWNELSWAEKKRIGMTEGRLYEGIKFEKTLDAPAKTRKPRKPGDAVVKKENLYEGATKPKTFRWTAKGLIEEGATPPPPPQGMNWFRRMRGEKVEPQPPSSGKKKSKGLVEVTPAQKQENAMTRRDIASQREALLKRRAAAQNKAKGARC
ncbi:MAG: hypothetical protein ACPHEP_01385 [Acidimicrobiales bacterium]